jgi:hypothetical protein
MIMVPEKELFQYGCVRRKLGRFLSITNVWFFAIGTYSAISVKMPFRNQDVVTEGCQREVF